MAENRHFRKFGIMNVNPRLLLNEKYFAKRSGCNKTVACSVLLWEKLF